MTERSSEGLDERRRKLLFRAWRRGVREMDLIVGRFADAYIDKFDAAGLDDFERLIEAPNSDLYAWVTGAESAPAPYDTMVLANRISYVGRHLFFPGGHFIAAAVEGNQSRAVAADHRETDCGSGRAGGHRAGEIGEHEPFGAWRRCRARSPSSRPTSRCSNSRPGIASRTIACRRMPA